MNKSKVIRKESNFFKEISKFEEVYIGVDTHKSTYTVAAFCEPYGVVKGFTMEAMPHKLAEMLARHRSRIQHVVYEAGPCGYTLVRTLRQKGLVADVVVTGSIPMPTTRQSKNDHIDARRLAELTARDQLEFVNIPTVREDEFREVLRRRNDERDERRRYMQKIKMFLLYHGIPEPRTGGDWSSAWVNDLRMRKLSEGLRESLDILLENYDFHTAHVSRLTSRLREILNSDEYRDTTKRLSTIPGVGLITAATIQMEAYRLDRFASPREIGKYCGLSPLENQSGEKNRNAGLAPSGNRCLRHTLIEAAWRWSNKDPIAAEWFMRYYRNTGNKKKAITALARKLAVIIWSMALNGRNYEPRPQFSPSSRQAS